MSDKIAKALARFTAKERQAVKDILVKINALDFQGLDIKKLQGQNNIFRVKKGKLRIIFRVAPNKQIYLLAIERRSEKTYRAF